MSDNTRLESADRLCHQQEPEHGLDRRRFVGMVSASVAASWLLRPPGTAWAEGGLPDGDSLVPGYLRPSHVAVRDETVLCRLSDPDHTFFETIRRAIPEDLPLDLMSSAQVHGLPEDFASGRARLWVHGLMPPDQVRQDRELLSAHLEVETAFGGDSHRHHAWSFGREPVANLPAPTSFEFPVDEHTELRLHMTIEREDGGVVIGGSKGRGGQEEPTGRTYTTVLTLKDRYDQPRLRPGIYALPLSAEADRALPLPANHDWLVPEDLLFLLLSIQPLGVVEG